MHRGKLMKNYVGYLTREQVVCGYAHRVFRNFNLQTDFIHKLCSVSSWNYHFLSTHGISSCQLNSAQSTFNGLHLPVSGENLDQKHHVYYECRQATSSISWHPSWRGDIHFQSMIALFLRTARLDLIIPRSWLPTVQHLHSIK